MGTSMKILVFSDIHGDLGALRNLLEIEADYYFAAGDMVSWARGLDNVGEILRRRAERMYVLPGNHESEDAIQEMCDRFSLHAFHGQTLEAGGYQFAGLGYSNPTPFNTPGEYSEQEIARRLVPFDELDPSDQQTGMGRAFSKPLRRINAIESWESIGLRPAAHETAREVVEFHGGEVRDDGCVMPEVRRLDQEATAWLQDAMHLVERALGIGQVFQDVGCKDDVELPIRIGQGLRKRDVRLV